MVVTRQGFTQVVQNAFAGFGFSPNEAPTMYEFPTELFIPGSDLTPINENIDKIIAGLTSWKPKTTSTGVVNAGANITVTGPDYPTALDNLNATFEQKLWTDGLPVYAPTQERVNWILQGTDMKPDDVIGSILPRGGIGTVRQMAIALAMAGGRPEYLPVVVAIAQVLVSHGANAGHQCV